MPHARSARIPAILLTAVASLAVPFAAPSGTRDNPVLDNPSPTCTLSPTVIETLPGASNLAGIAGLTPGAVSPLSVDFRFNRRERPTHVLIDGAGLDLTARVRLFNPERCEVVTSPTKAVFGDGFSGLMTFVYRQEPSPWARATITNVRKGRELFPILRLEYGLPGATAGPGPQDPGSPVVPGPGQDSPGFTGWQDLGGPIIRDRGVFFGSFKPRQHSQEDCAEHTVNGVSLCVVLGSGPTSVVVSNATPSRFDYQSVGPSIPNLSFGVGYCDLDRCETQGTFFGQPVRKTLSGWRASGADLLADTTVFFKQGQFRLAYRGKYSYDPDSTQITPPSPSVPIVPAPDPTESGFLIPNWGRLTVGLTGRYRVSVLPHENHDLHSVMVGGVQKFLCTEGVGEGAAKIDQINPDSVLLRKTSPQRAGWQWSPIVFSNSPEGLRGVADGTFYGKPVKATFWGLEARQGSPDFSMSHSVKLLETQSEVPFRLEGRVDLTPKF